MTNIRNIKSSIVCVTFDRLNASLNIKPAAVRQDATNKTSQPAAQQPNPKLVTRIKPASAAEP